MPGNLQDRGDGVAIPSSNKVVISTTIDVLDADSNPIGFIQSLNRTDTRRADRIRHLDALDAGRTIEQAPGPEDLTLRVTGFALYAASAISGAIGKGTLLDRLIATDNFTAQTSNQTIGGFMRSLHSQVIPFEVMERWTHPAAGDPVVDQAGQILYGDCVMTNYTRPINITTITIAEEVQLQPTWIDEP